MSTPNKTTKPRPSDVARWVAILAEPFPAGQGREVIRHYNADCDKSLDGLTRYGLDAHGNPKAEACCPRGATEPAPIHAMLGCDNSPEPR